MSEPTQNNISHAERLLAYARIFEAPRYDPVSGTRIPAGDACVAAAEALRFYAASLMNGAP